MLTIDKNEGASGERVFYFPFLICLLFFAQACSYRGSSSVKGLASAAQVSPSVTPKPRNLDAMLYRCLEFSIELHSDGRWTKYVDGPETSIQSGKLDPEVVEPLLVLAEECDRHVTFEIKKPKKTYFELEVDTVRNPFSNGGHLLFTSSPDGNRYLRDSKWMNIGLRLKLEALPLVEPQPDPEANRLLSHIPLRAICGNGTQAPGDNDFSLDSTGVFVETTIYGKSQSRTCFRLDQSETDRIFAGLKVEQKANRPPKRHCRCCDESWIMEAPPFEFHDESGSHKLHRSLIDPLLLSLHERKYDLFAPWIVKIGRNAGPADWIAWEGEDVAPLFSELQRAWDLQVAKAGPVQFLYGTPPRGSFYVELMNPNDRSNYTRGYTRGWIDAKTNPELHALMARLCNGLPTKDFSKN